MESGTRLSMPLRSHRDVLCARSNSVMGEAGDTHVCKTRGQRSPTEQTLSGSTLGQEGPAGRVNE